MATLEECAAAMQRLADRMHGMDEDTRGRTMLDRSVSCHLRDIGVTFGAQLRDGTLQNIRQVDSADGQIRLTMTSDDLLELVDGSLQFGKAWASGRVKVHASVFDLLKLRTMI
jgi:hypothetical protein